MHIFFFFQLVIVPHKNYCNEQIGIIFCEDTHVCDMTILYLPYLKITLQPLEESRACEHVRCQDNGEEDDPGVVLREASAQAHHRRLSSFRQPADAARDPHRRSSSEVGGASSAVEKEFTNKYKDV